MPFKQFVELNNTLELMDCKDELVNSRVLNIVSSKKKDYPIVGFTVGTQDKSKPTFGIFGGVHGLERVGSHVVLTFLGNLINRLSWDTELRESFNDFRIVAIPVINPAGMDHVLRSNLNGVDLMRNAPVECQEKPWPLVSGHRYSNKIPWYRGEESKEMELEAKTLVDFVKEEMFPSKSSFALDIHSGFGMRDRLWYPYAKTRNDFPYKYETYKVEQLLDKTLPHHIYIVEPQSASYVTNGDLWDHLFDLKYSDPNLLGHFIPWTLELGSWSWVKKNPLQLFSILGMYNPLKKHRFDRIMRRHLLLIDFLCSIVKNPESWTLDGNKEDDDVA